MKQKLVNWLLGVIGTLILAVGGMILQRVWDVPQIKKDLDEFQTDQAENNKTYNSMLYQLNKKEREREIVDSLKNSKH